MQNIRKNPINGKGADIARDLYGGRAMHGDSTPATDRAAVSDEWCRIWRLVIRTLTPLQKEALAIELGRAEK